MHCRFCNHTLKHVFLDLVNSPPSNSFLTEQELLEPEVFYPLKLYVCEACFLVQIDEYKKSADIFSGRYAYFSSVSSTWLAHANKYVDMIIDRLELNSQSTVVEIASNDGYLLQYFNARGIPNMGIEPSANVAEIAKQKGINVITEFFDTHLAGRLRKQGVRADLIIGNNVLAHVPNINDFVAGLKLLLEIDGVITMEFPHLMQLMDNNQFDTIYHEHFSYFSFSTVEKIFNSKGLVVFDVENLKTHGGSLRIYAGHAASHAHRNSDNVIDMRNAEISAGMNRLDYYKHFQTQADKVKIELVDFLIKQKKKGKRIAAYGAAAKGNTLLNYCGIKKDLLDFVSDASRHKQGKFLPGSHIPVCSPEAIAEKKPDYVLILPWNIQDEIMLQLEYIKKWNGRFVVPIPKLKVI